MNYLSFFAAVFLSYSSHAGEGARIACQGTGTEAGLEIKISLSARILSPMQLGNVLWNSESPRGKNFLVVSRMDGKWEPSANSPQEGIRYYFIQGRISDFLHIPGDGIAFRLYAATEQEILESIAAKDHRFEFRMQHIREDLARNSDQEINELLCVPL